MALLCLLCAASTHGQDLTIGVVEFDEKNDIGLENDGRTVAEWVVTGRKRIRSFEISERLMLRKVLEEQEQMLSVVIDEGQVAKIGNIYGVGAIVPGSVLRVGSRGNITARIVNDAAPAPFFVNRVDWSPDAYAP